MIILSICIPTYNRAEFLPRLFDSIKARDLSVIQVVVSDNASTDNTRIIVEQYRNLFPNFEYKCNDTNVGFDRNVYSAATMGRGEYILIMGSDDVFMPGALDDILDYLESKPDILIYNRQECDDEFHTLRVTRYANYKAASTKLVIRDEDDIVSYFKHVTSLCGVFSYISSVVFRSDRLNYPEYAVGTGYIHAAIQLTILREGGTICYTQSVLVGCRIEGSFREKLADKLLFLDLNGYGLFAEKIFDHYHRAASLLLYIAVRPYLGIKFSIKGKFFMDKKDWLRFLFWIRKNRALLPKRDIYKFYLYNLLTPLYAIPRWFVSLAVSFLYKTIHHRAIPWSIRGGES